MVELQNFTGWQEGANYLYSGDVFRAMIFPFVWTMGVWFYLIVAFMGMMMIYIKTQNFNTTIITGLIISAGFIPFLSTVDGFATAIPAIYGFVVLAIAGILYKIFKG